MFTKADFKNGEMAALIQIGEAARRCSGSYIIEAPVTKITVSLSWGNIQFEYYENDNRFYQKSEYSPDYELYPTRAIAEEVLKRRKLVSDILKLLRNMENSQKFEKMSTEEMEKLKTILEQY